MPHWDGSITLGNILTILIILWPVIRLSVLLREFPLHRHENGKILYPKGMRPDIPDAD